MSGLMVRNFAESQLHSKIADPSRTVRSETPRAILVVTWPPVAGASGAQSKKLIRRLEARLTFFSRAAGVEVGSVAVRLSRSGEDGV